ncbi:hypothetical protein M404DRAFT_964384 [Pisolithus tinctorius Marx 270]|uniref:Uncharacterized protein n=1 Tax=Pisolithus tinctorius Marx 270 TaxID=870435 RepID=A0A0C3IS86_PISTI|nr:hypothetical protein M404DRAFT_964384 [Pisolithus tinctorius Marx 270]
MDDARSRLRWASSRRTTRPEDVAYSLFGIFNLHLPVLYGESAESALGRLLGKVISYHGLGISRCWTGLGRHRRFIAVSRPALHGTSHCHCPLSLQPGQKSSH